MKKLLLALTLMAAGCTHPISEESMKLVENSVGLRQVRENPDAFTGRNILVGGVIARVANDASGGEMEVVQFPLTGRELPDRSALSEGRFLAKMETFVDPVVYMPGMLVTLVGEVKGSKTRELQNVEYRYPVIAVREIHLWQPNELPQEPRIHFGIGVGFGHVF